MSRNATLLVATSAVFWSLHIKPYFLVEFYVGIDCIQAFLSRSLPKTIMVLLFANVYYSEVPVLVVTLALSAVSNIISLCPC